MIEYLKRTSEISILDTILIGVISAVIGSILVLIIVSLSKQILAFITYVIKLIFKTPLEKLEYSYRIVRKKPKMKDLIHIEGKFPKLRANRLELRAYKNLNKRFTSMEDYNKKMILSKDFKPEINQSLTKYIQK